MMGPAKILSKKVKRIAAHRLEAKVSALDA